MNSMLRIARLATFLITLSVACVALAQPFAKAGHRLPAMVASTAPAPQGPGVGDRSAKAKEPEDEEAAFKYSPAVRGIAKITGVSLNAAYWICVVINFAIVAGLILLAMKSSVPAMLRGRTQEIQKGIDEARRASEQAGRRLHEVEERLSRLNLEIGEFQKRAEQEARAEEERIRASLAEEKRKIIEAAETEVTQAANAARRELQKYAVTLAVEMAEKGIHIDPAEDSALVENFAEQLGADSRRNGKH
jgi:F-type H+-transporting ATPase subunit b